MVPTPGISSGYWKARKMPAAARSSAAISSTFCAVEQDLAVEDLVVLLAGDHVGEGRLARAVRPHDGGDLAVVHGEVQAVEDAVVLDLHDEVLDFQHVSPSPSKPFVPIAAGSRRSRPDSRRGRRSPRRCRTAQRRAVIGDPPAISSGAKTAGEEASAPDAARDRRRATAVDGPRAAGRRRIGPGGQPTEPSRLIEISFCASTANSIGSCCSTSLTKPLTMSAIASSSDRPRCRQ